METETPVRCPHLLSMSFHDNLVASTLSNLVGTFVEFQCTGTNPILSGPSAIRCRTSGKWNSTLPTCIASDVEDSTISFTEEVSVTPTPTASPDEREVETVLIVLWIAGGLLLMSLLIMIGCILKTHKKRQGNRESSRRFPTQGDPRHGGVNPTFTSYDEIWTWIPVVTENADNCRSQPRGATSGRDIGVNESNSESARNARLPSYNEAIHNSTANRTTTQNASGRPTTQQASAGPSHSATNQTTLQIRPIINTTNQASVSDRDVIRPSRSQDASNTQSNRTSHVTMETNHYETIPANQNSRLPANGNNVTYVSVTSSSGSALQQARDLVNRASAHAQRPLPSAPVIQTANRHESQANHRHHTRPSESSRTSTSHHSRPAPGVPTQPVYLPRHSHITQDFHHSNNSVFTYIGDHVHGARLHSPYTSRDGPPPPYSIARTQDQVVSIPRTSAPVGTSSVLRGLESHYF